MSAAPDEPGARAAVERREFETPAAFRDWLAEHADRASELVVVFRKRRRGPSGITWPEAVDEALCFGSIDGVRKGIDDERYQIRFTPRKPQSTWSAVNIGRVAVLEAEGRVQAAGRAAFERRTERRTGMYSYEQRDAPALRPDEEASLRANAAAWSFFERQPPGDRTKALWHVVSAKWEPTGAGRLAALIERCAGEQRLRPRAVDPMRPTSTRGGAADDAGQRRPVGPGNGDDGRAAPDTTARPSSRSST